MKKYIFSKIDAQNNAIVETYDKGITEILSQFDLNNRKNQLQAKIDLLQADIDEIDAVLARFP